MRGLGMAAAVLAAALLAAPAAAEEPQKQPGAVELLDEAARKVYEALKLMLLAIPQYDAPEITPEGDIVIRRIRPPADGKPEKPVERPAEPERTRI